MAPTVTADHLNPQTWSDDQIWEALARRLGHDRRLGVAPGTRRRPQRAADAQLVNGADALRPVVLGRGGLDAEAGTKGRLDVFNSSARMPSANRLHVSSRANPGRSCCSDWPRRRTIPLFAAEG